MTEEREEIVKILFWTLIAIAVSFCIINLTWYWGVKIRYDDAIQDLHKLDSTEQTNQTGLVDGMCEIVEDGYRYRVYDTKYLKSTGFACVCADTGWMSEEEKPERITAEDGTNVVLNIGFKVFSRYSFQVDIENVDGSYQINVDKYGKLIANKYEDPQFIKEMNIILDQNREEIEILLSLADDTWNIR